MWKFIKRNVKDIMNIIHNSNSTEKNLLDGIRINDILIEDLDKHEFDVLFPKNDVDKLDRTFLGKPCMIETKRTYITNKIYEIKFTFDTYFPTEVRNAISFKYSGLYEYSNDIFIFVNGELKISEFSKLDKEYIYFKTTTVLTYTSSINKELADKEEIELDKNKLIKLVSEDLKGI